MTTTLGPGSLVFTNGSTENNCGTLTAAGIATFSTAAANQCGSYIAHDAITGAGLTVFMTGDGTGAPIVAGLPYGSGYIMYSGLTDHQFHSSGSSLLANIAGYTAQVPEPGTLTLAGAGLILAGALLRRKRSHLS